MIECCSVFANPLANAVRCSLSISKTGIVALSAESLVSIPGMNLTPHELMGYLVNLSFSKQSPLQVKSISFSPADKTLGHIVKKIGLDMINHDCVDLDSPIFVITDTFRLNVIIATHTVASPLDKSIVEDYAASQGISVDLMVVSSFPMMQENTFPYKIEPIGWGKSRITFTNVPESVVLEHVKRLPDLFKK